MTVLLLLFIIIICNPLWKIRASGIAQLSSRISQDESQTDEKMKTMNYFRGCPINEEQDLHHVARKMRQSQNKQTNKCVKKTTNQPSIKPSLQ